MRRVQTLADTAAMVLSQVCVIHCLALPVMTMALPTFVSLYLEGEAFHYWMLVLVLPTSFLALTMGCNEHRKVRIVLFGAAGLTLLVFAALLGHELFGEMGEKSLTVLGACMVAVAHWLNYKTCRHLHCS